MSKISRREVLVAGGGVLVWAACGKPSEKTTAKSTAEALVAPSDPVVASREAQRRRAGAVEVAATVTAAPTTVSIGGRSVETWAFGDRPGAGGLRAKAGDLLAVKFVNKLAAANTVHWHGIALRNDMDGVHDLTQPATEPAGEFTYRFTAPDAGTYWFHPHTGLELDRGLYAPLIIEDPGEDIADVEHTLILDDWLDGYGRTPEDVLRELQSAGGHSAGAMSDHMGDHMAGAAGAGGMATMMAGFAGDVAYPLHLINGRAPGERETFAAQPGQRVRLRLINAGSDTAYRVAVESHRLSVTHADGFPVVPVEVDNVVLGMGERYDVVLTAGSGAFAIVALPEGKSDPAGEAVLRTAATAAPPPTGTRPSGLTGAALKYTDLHATEAVTLPTKRPDRTQTVRLTAIPEGYVHGIDGKSFPDAAPITVHEGERLRIRVVNNTMMFHPIHVHGHTFAMVSAGSARKDTVSVEAMTAVEFDIEADNPGQWMFHCHNTYHLETGMATTLSYRR